MFSVQATDPDGDELEYLWECSHGEFLEENNGIAEWRAPSGEVYAEVTVTVSDGNDGFDLQKWNLEIMKSIEEPGLVDFADPNLERAFLEDLGKTDGEINTVEIREITQLWAIERGISSLEGIQYATGLQDLNLCLNEISDLEPLRGLTSLVKLELENNMIYDAGP